MTLSQWCWKRTRNRKKKKSICSLYIHIFLLFHFTSLSFRPITLETYRCKTFRILCEEAPANVFDEKANIRCFFFFFLLLLNLVRNIQHGGVMSTSRSAGRNRGATRASDRYSPSRCFAANWLRRRVAGMPTSNPVGGVAVIFSGLIRPAGDEEGTWEVERLHHPKVSKRMIPK